MFKTRKRCFEILERKARSTLHNGFWEVSHHPSLSLSVSAEREGDDERLIDFEILLKRESATLRKDLLILFRFESFLRVRVSVRFFGIIR